MQNRMLNVIARAQSNFIADTDSRSAFDNLLADLLTLTESEYGFIGEVLYAANGQPYLKTYAITNIAWNEATRNFYAENAPTGMLFHNLNTLFGHVLTSATPVIANDPYHDPRRGGLPEGHPALNAFLGIPILANGHLVAMAGLANRPDGYDQALIDYLQPLLVTIGQLVEAWRTEQARRRTADMLRNILDSAYEVSIIATDPDGLITTFNHGAERLLGYRAEDMVARQSPAILHLADEVAVRGRELSAELGRPVEGFRVFVEKPELNGSEKREWTYVHKDGHPIPVSLVVTPMRAGTGQILGYLGIAEDISAQKQAEARLSAQALHTQAILDNVIDGIITIDERGTVASFNRAAERIFGFPATAVLGRNVNMLMPEPYHSAHDGYLANYMATGVERIIGIGREVVGRRMNGDTFPMDLAVSEISHDGQRMFVGLVRDITERKRVEQMKSEFVSTVSHELRTPLTSIAGALGLLTGGVLGELPPQMKPLLDIALKNSQRLSHLINDLLDMEKIAAGKLHFDIQPLAIMPLVEQALEANKAYADQCRVRFDLVERAEAVEVLVDGQRFQQVLANLLSNAAKFSPEDSVVEIAAHRLDGRVRVSVRDHGPGIPTEFHPRIFEKFSQADASDTRQKGGTGLGLAITKGLVERMGGKIGFESIEGRGTTFWVELSIRQHAPDRPLDTLPLDLANSDVPRILVVEDDPDIAHLIALMLSRAGYTTTIAGTGEQALALLSAGGYAAMTLDLGLPGISGLEVINQARQNPMTAELPIIVVSARIEEGRLAINGDGSAVDWLPKPLDEGRLLAMVEQVLPQERPDRPRILHVEDDIDLHQVVGAMAGAHIDLEHAANLSEARAMLGLVRYDVVILDLALPDGSGWELLPLLRGQTKPPRVIILSGTELSHEEAGKVEACLLKSHVSQHELLDAINARITKSRSHRHE